MKYKMIQHTDILRSNGLFYKHLPSTLLKHITKDIMKRYLTFDEINTLSLIYYSGHNGVTIGEIYYHFGGNKNIALSVIRELAYHGIIDASEKDGNNNFEQVHMYINTNFMFWGFRITKDDDANKLYDEWFNLWEAEKEYTNNEISVNNFENGKTFQINKKTQ